MTSRLGSELKGESRVEDVVAIAVLVLHIKRSGEESVYRARVNEVKKVMLDDDFSESCAKAYIGNEI
jgi:hypothetical protein